MIVLPVCVDHEQHGRAFGLDLKGSDGVPSLFTRFVHTVKTDESPFVFEGQCRQLE